MQSQYVDHWHRLLLHDLLLLRYVERIHARSRNELSRATAWRAKRAIENDIANYIAYLGGMGGDW